MKYYILILSIIFLLNGCNKSSSNITYITECEAGNQLNSVTHEVPPIILSPFSLCVTNDKLVILESKSDTIFNVFNIKNFQHIYNDGIKGGGPNEFLTIAPHYFSPTNKGFKVLFAETNDINEYAVTNSGITFEKKDNLKIERKGLNGLTFLDDEKYIITSDFNSDHEYEILDNSSGEITKMGIYPEETKNTSINDIERYTLYLKNGVSHPSGKYFASFYLNFKRMRIYDKKGNIIKDIILKIEPYNSNINDEINDRIVYYYTSPIADNKYIYVLCANKNRNNYFNKMPELQIWDWSGNLISRHQCDKNISMITLDKSRNKIYALDYYVENEIYEYDLSQIHDN
ncbi:BF3164 family lipoprotein [Parabacteroides goldsteinii]|uniref:BF3164 family lipoprotein n=1 Tax=Parabacteroides goldsteinii TaxID=328812 RepID=UPI00242BD2EB|nr:BF3164 family lipoprotein [Parabacteroides goldsteinii]